MRNIIFIAGIHGVGKSSLCKKLSDKFSMEYYSVSDLIRKTTHKAADKNKRVSNIEDNQKVFLKALDSVLLKNKTLLLDGHFCLISNDDSIQSIELQVFKMINPSAIIVLEDTPKKIMQRLISRDSLSFDEAFIKNLQQKEIATASKVANELKVPFKIFKNNGNFEEQIMFIKKYVGGNINGI